MRTIGLTGGIGSGKTTVANFFKDLGVPVYIADIEGKRLMQESEEVRKQILGLFGPEAYTGKVLNRQYISSKVFKDKTLLEALNAIVHPAVRKDFETWRNQQKASYVIYEAAILFESGSDRNCDQIIVVTARKEDRIKRLQKRDQSSIADIEARIANQWSDEKKVRFANIVIENEDLEKTWQRVNEIHQNLLETA